MTKIPKTSEPAQRAFAEAGITSLEDFSRYKASEILKLHGVGPKSIRILKAALKEIGKSFKA